MSQCVDAMPSITPMLAKFGGIQTFYDIAKGISDGLQSTPNSKTYNDLNNLLFGTGPNVTSTSQVVKDMVVNQIGDIIFWSIGFVLILAALVLGLTTAIWQCCATCQPQRATRGRICGWVLVAWFSVAFSLILTGVVLFNVAQTDLTHSIDRGDVYTTRISGDLSEVFSNGTSQISCAVSSTTDRMFNSLEVQMSNYSLIVVAGAKNATGFTGLYMFNDTAYNQLLADTTLSGQQLQTDLSTVDGCATTLHNYTAQIVKVQEILTSFDGLSTQLTPLIVSLNENFLSVQKVIQKQADQANLAMEQTQDQISNSLDSMNTMIYDLDSDIKNIINSVKQARLDIVTSSEYTATQIIARLLINIPCGVALCFSALSIIIIVHRQVASASHDSMLAAYSILVAFYTTVLLAIVLLLCSSALFVAGWIVSAGCVPIFQDQNYGLFHLINFTSPSFNGQQATINAGDALNACQPPSETVFAALNGAQFISRDSINRDLNLQQFQDAADSQIRDNSPPMFNVSTDEYHANLDALRLAYSTLQQFDLSTLCEFNNPDVASYLGDVNATILATTQYLELIDNLNQNSGNLTNITVTINDQQFQQGGVTINGSIDALLNNLETQAFKCLPIVEIYRNGGNVICEQYGEPVHGLWASVGLTGVVTFILAILLIATYRWLTSQERIAEEKERAFQWRRGSSSRTRRVHVADPAEVDIFEKPTIRHLYNDTPTFQRGLPRSTVEMYGLPRTNYSTPSVEEKEEEERWPTGGRGLKRTHF